MLKLAGYTFVPLNLHYIDIINKKNLLDNRLDHFSIISTQSKEFKNYETRRIKLEGKRSAHESNSLRYSSRDSCV